jgi:hypothetical protein
VGDLMPGPYAANPSGSSSAGDPGACNELIPTVVPITKSQIDLPSAIACYHALQDSVHIYPGQPPGYVMIDARTANLGVGPLVFTNQTARYFPVTIATAAQFPNRISQQGEFHNLATGDARELEKRLGPGGNDVLNDDTRGALATFIERRLIQLEHEVRTPAPNPTPLKYNDSGPGIYETVDAVDLKKALLSCEHVTSESCVNGQTCVKDVASIIDGQITRCFNIGNYYDGNTYVPAPSSGGAR